MRLGWPNATAGRTAFKMLVFPLLVLNAILFLLRNPLYDAMDSVGWLIVLLALEYETSSLHERYESRWEHLGLIGSQIAGYSLVALATLSYVRLGETVALANSATWLLVCAALAYDVYAPGSYGTLEWRIRNGVKLTLYAILCAIAAWWGYEGLAQPGAGLWGLLNGYDALLWIACFAVVEVNVVTAETTLPIVPA